MTPEERIRKAVELSKEANKLLNCEDECIIDGVRFVYNPISHYPWGKYGVHVYEGIELLGETYEKNGRLEIDFGDFVVFQHRKEEEE